jgi:hypothetical protein
VIARAVLRSGLKAGKSQSSDGLPGQEMMDAQAVPVLKNRLDALVFADKLCNKLAENDAFVQLAGDQLDVGL